MIDAAADASGPPGRRARRWRVASPPRPVPHRPRASRPRTRRSRPTRRGTRISSRSLRSHPDVQLTRNKWEARVLRLARRFGLPDPIPNLKCSSVEGSAISMPRGEPSLVFLEFDGFDPHMASRHVVRRRSRTPERSRRCGLDRLPIHVHDARSVSAPPFRAHRPRLCHTDLALTQRLCDTAGTLS